MPDRSLVLIEDAEDPRIAEFRGVRERDLVLRQERFVAEGTVVLRMLAAAHAAGSARAEKILVLKNRVQGVSDILDRFPAEVPVYVAEAEVIDQIAGFHLHRGVLALGRRAPQPALGDLLTGLGSPTLVLVGCGISNHDNIGSMFRNAAAFSVDAVLLDETCCDPLYRKAIRVSVGSVLSVPYHRGGSTQVLLSQLAEAGFAIWALSPAGDTELRDLPRSDRMALVMGTEGEGLPAEVLRAYKSVRIAQSRGLDSLNVGTAAGIALYGAALAQGRIG
ncbi:RNA methyltransferase [Rhizobium sp. RU36D]|uniref:TrmH family RNA methyltransferase n=1 Tax=Rhizobium sp. RU36D TaxID=1907415 RepID=UPI0009D889D6|nr:RNA methyltransferase [Rhizobium sp. RU36D]SMC40308.1 tRNA G18 (ribose-2'-O)-methylase SpoU [Rhizobium sp. RU36D]